MEWTDGKHFIASFQEVGITYNLWVRKYAGDPATIWHLFLSKGDWQVANPETIWTRITDETKIPTNPNTTIEQLYVSIKTQIINPLNIFLKDYFKGGIVLPQTLTLFEKVEAILKSLIFFRGEAGKPQIESSLLSPVQQRINTYIVQFGSPRAYADAIKIKESQGIPIGDPEAAALFKLLYPELF